MERAIYFDAWQRRGACQHPSMPMRNLDMIEDLKRYHATMLVWSAMGGGSISLPYLEREINGIPEPRLRIYGYLNEREYVHLCRESGIDPFAIVYEVQDWEFPAKFDENGKLTALNVTAGDSEDWYGLREFSNGTRDAAFPTTLKDYYPEGIINSAGETVTDLHLEAASLDQYGTPIHAKWVEVKGRRAECYQACRNNPVWRNYLKKIIYMQAKGGARAIQLDECELPMTSMGSGGCFCRDCVSQFTEFLKARRDEKKLGPEWNGIDVESFNYRDYLNEQGIRFNKQAPFYRDYWEFQMRAVKKYFTELADYVHSLSVEFGEKMRVSGNFYNLMPTYYPFQPTVDVVITEMAHTLLHQPYFFRYCAGFGGGKPVIVTENPYGGMMAELLDMMDRGRGYDLYRVFLMEASVYGCNMSIPYGAWMGNTIHDGFMAPHWLNCEVQDYLYENERYFTSKTDGAALVIYSFKSNYWDEANSQSYGNEGTNNENPTIESQISGVYSDPSRRLDFWKVTKQLSAAQVQYDVLITPDGILREDDFDESALEGYRVVVLPDCYEMTDHQVDVLCRWAAEGGRIVVHGRCYARERFEKAGAVFTEDFMEGFMPVYNGQSTVSCSDGLLGLRRCDGVNFAAVHLINYAYDMQTDKTAPSKSVELTIKGDFTSARAITADGEAMVYAEPVSGGFKAKFDMDKVYMTVIFDK